MAGRVVENLDDDYAKAGFGRRIGFGKKSALLVVDVVMAYLDPASPLYAKVEDESEAVKRVLEAARAAGLLVAFSNVVYTPGCMDAGVFFKKTPALDCFVEGNPFGRFPEGIAPQKGEILVTKQYPSAFFGTSLAATLRTQEVDTCIIVGFTTSGCIRATALDAMQNGFIPVLVDEACGERDVRIHNANMFDLNAKYADVVKLADALEAIRAMAPKD